MQVTVCPSALLFCLLFCNHGLFSSLLSESTAQCSHLCLCSWVSLLSCLLCHCGSSLATFCHCWLLLSPGWLLFLLLVYSLPSHIESPACFRLALWAFVLPLNWPDILVQRFLFLAFFSELYSWVDVWVQDYDLLLKGGCLFDCCVNSWIGTV